SFAKIGKKMLSLKPLGKQVVSTTDSTLGPLADSPKGLTATYSDLIKQAFNSRFWSNTSEIVTFSPSGHKNTEPAPGGSLTTDQFTQMEANFPFFFGLAVQAYEATLISNQTPFDRFASGDATALTDQQKAGLNTFTGAGHCAECHSGALFTKATVDQV